MEVTHILITGSDGQIGQALQHCWQKNKQVKLLALNHQNLDICDEVAIRQWLHDFRPKIIINAAAYTAVETAEHCPQQAFAVNADGIGLLAKVAEEIQATLIHFSSDYVFDGKKNTPYTEQDNTHALNVYGASKLAGELAAIAACSRSIVLRTSWVFSEYGHNFVKTILRLAQTQDTLHVVADQMGCPTSASGIAQTVAAIVEKILNQQTVQYGVYHYAGLPSVSWFEFAQYILQQAKQQGILVNLPQLYPVEGTYFSNTPRPAYSCLDCHKIQTIFHVSADDWRKKLDNLTPYLPKG